MSDNKLPDLCVVGSVNLDIIATTQRLPGPGETIGDGALSFQPGGKGGNQAAAAAHLGGRVRMVGAVGDDDAGRQVTKSLAAAGVDINHIRTVSEPTGTALIVVDHAGENQIAVCPGANGLIELGDVEFQADEVVLCQLEIDTHVVLEAARRTTGFFALNAAPSKSLPAELIERADLVIVNETERAEIPELASSRLVAVTYGGKGAALYSDGQLVASAPARSVKVLNSIGAGDAFCAALVLALRSGLGHQDSLELACGVGAAAVQDLASQPRFDHLFTYAGDRAVPR